MVKNICSENSRNSHISPINVFIMIIDLELIAILLRLIRTLNLAFCKINRLENGISAWFKKLYFVRNPAVPYWISPLEPFGCLAFPTFCTACHDSIFSKKFQIITQGPITFTSMKLLRKVYACHRHSPSALISEHFKAAI